MSKNNSHQNHEKMIVWQSADQLDIIVQKILRKIPKFEYKLKEQMDSASDSIGSNFVEGFYSGSINEYIKFCRYSRRSCGELQERVRRALRKNYVCQEEFERFNKRAIITGYLFDRLINSLQVKKNK